MHSLRLQPLTHFLADSKLTSTTGALSAPGYMVGLDGKVVEEFVVAKVNSHQPLLTALLHNAMPTQNSLLLLRLCALPRLNFLCRTISPRLTSSRPCLLVH